MTFSTRTWTNGLVLITFLASSAFAGTINFAGDTTGGPVWRRPIAGFGALSGVGTAVGYETTLLNVGLDGIYVFQSTAGYDNFTFLYRDSFDPATPFANGIIGNDDNPSGDYTHSGFSVGLTAGATYVLVNTGYANTDHGTYSQTITGPGEISLVPEPVSMLLLGAGMVGLAGYRRFRRQ